MKRMILIGILVVYVIAFPGFQSRDNAVATRLEEAKTKQVGTISDCSSAELFASQC